MARRKILHIMHDDKFNDRAVLRFNEVDPDGSVFVAVHPAEMPFAYIKSSEVRKCTQKEICTLLHSSDFGAVIFHGLSSHKAVFFKHISNDVKVVWIGWGYDYYEALLGEKFGGYQGLLEPLTIQQFVDSRSRLRRFVGKVKQSIKKVKGVRGGALSKRQYSRIDVFVPVLEREWRWSRELNPWFRAAYSPWIYVRETGDLMPPEVLPNADSILVGNSASLTNNHIDAYKALADFRKSGEFSRVISPLSYGRKDVASKVIDAGRYYFGPRFWPITEFKPKNEYWELVRNCHTVVMNHIRQQGAGVLNRAFSSGARVILNKRSVLAEEYSDRGLYFDLLGNHRLGPLGRDVASGNVRAQKFWKLSRANPQILKDFIAQLNL